MRWEGNEPSWAKLSRAGPSFMNFLDKCPFCSQNRFTPNSNYLSISQTNRFQLAAVGDNFELIMIWQDIAWLATHKLWPVGLQSCGRKKKPIFDQLLFCWFPFKHSTSSEMEALFYKFLRRIWLRNGTKWNGKEKQNQGVEDAAARKMQINQTPTTLIAPIRDCWFLPSRHLVTIPSDAPRNI